MLAQMVRPSTKETAFDRMWPTFLLTKFLRCPILILGIEYQNSPQNSFHGFLFGNVIIQSKVKIKSIYKFLKLFIGMTNSIVPYKQTLSHSCLVADFLMLLEQKYEITFNKKDEVKLLIDGMNRKYLFYVVGCPTEIFEKHKKKIGIVVDNKYFTDVLIKEFNDKENFNIFHEKINTKTIGRFLEKGPLICHIDDNYLGDYSHASHFIILDKMTDKMITIVDPMTGKRGSISHKKLEDSINSLKNHIKMCPLLFYLE